MKGTRMWRPLTAGALLLVMLAGCGNSPSSPESSASPSSTAASSAAASQSESEGLPKMDKITIAMAAHPNVENYDTNYFTQKIMEDNDVQLEFMLLPADRNDAKTKFSLMVSSNSQLPDVLNLNIGDMTAFDYASKGVLTALNDYYTDPELAPQHPEHRGGGAGFHLQVPGSARRQCLLPLQLWSQRLECGTLPHLDQPELAG